MRRLRQRQADLFGGDPETPPEDVRLRRTRGQRFDMGAGIDQLPMYR